MKITMRSQLTGKYSTRDLPVTVEQLDELARPAPQRRLVQEIFPDLSASDREFLKTGITDEEWDAAYSEDGGDLELDPSMEVHLAMKGAGLL